MRILTATFFRYYNGPVGIEPQFYYLYRVPERMGFTVDFFDYQAALAVGLHAMRRLFLTLVRGGDYQAIFIATHQDEFDRETLAEANQRVPVFGWNSDDEWRWDSYSSQWVDAYRFMVTNSPKVYAEQKPRHPNLLHAQWACTGFWDGQHTPKDIDFSFVGQAYEPRLSQLRWLARSAGLQAFGKGTGGVRRNAAGSGWKATLRRHFRPLALRLYPELADDTLTFEQVNELWNRTRVSFTPLDSSSGGVRQIKSRVFDMGLSGTLMLAHRAPHLDAYYEPDREYVPFETLEEGADKATYFLRHEAERRHIADAYRERTLREHLWEHRIRHVLRSAGLLSSATPAPVP